MRRNLVVATWLIGSACTFGGGSLATGSGGSGGPAGTSGTAPATTSDRPTPSTSTSTEDGEGDRDSGSELETGSTSVVGTDTTAGDESAGTGSSSTGGTPLPSGPFGPAVLIAEVSDAFTNDDDPTVRSDELEMYFNAKRNDGDSIWVSTRASTNEAWGSPTLVPALSSEASDTTPKLSEDGLMMTLSSNRAGGDFDLYVAYRPDVDSGWSAPTLVGGVNTPEGEYAALVFDETVYFCRVTGKTPFQIFEAEVLNFQPLSFGAASVLAPPTQDAQICAPTIRSDRRELFVSEDGPQGFEIKRVERDDASDPWGDTASEDAINADFVAEDPWLSQDGHRLYFAGFPKKFKGAQGIYVAER